MAGTSTIMIVRADLSIVGAEEESGANRRQQGEIEAHFFALVRDNRPDVIVLDLRNAAHRGLEAIRKIRWQTGIPILVICDAVDTACDAGDIAVRDYLTAGAAECLAAPVDIVQINQTIQRIIRLTGPGMPSPPHQPDTVAVAGMTFHPYQNTLSGDGATVRLTTAENHLLTHLVSRPRRVCSRGEIAGILYGRYRPTSDRAIDVVVTRLRKKLASLRGPAAEALIKTEFRRGYMFVGDVSTEPLLAASESEAA
jgi:two-component system, OmpR family, response regulator